jgi:SAM-dependent methyltransferase
MSPMQSRSISRQCWCGGQSGTIIASLKTPDGLALEVARCDTCGVEFFHPQLTVEQLIPYYDDQYYGGSRKKFVGLLAWFVGTYQRIRSGSVAAQVAPGGRVLDIGCGNGGFLIEMKRRGFQVEGTELSESSARRMPAEAGIEVHVGDLTALQLPAGQYDAITLWHVLEHVIDPAETLRQANRLLKPDGKLFISIPNAEGWQARLFGTDWFHLDPPRHLFAFGPRSIVPLLRASGFEMQTFHTRSLEQNPFGFMQSLLNKMGFPRDRAYGSLKSQTRFHWTTRLFDMFLLALLLLPAVVHTTISGMIRRGATMTLVARSVSRGK